MKKKNHFRIFERKITDYHNQDINEFKAKAKQSAVDWKSEQDHATLSERDRQTAEKMLSQEERMEWDAKRSSKHGFKTPQDQEDYDKFLTKRFNTEQHIQPTEFSHENKAFSKLVRKEVRKLP